MYCDYTNKPKRYYHHNCWENEVVRREELSKEKTEWGALIDFIKQVHSLYDVPRPFYPFLQDIRNGTVRFGGAVQNKHKEGIKYSVLLEAYRMSAENIKWARKNKNFNNNTFAELKYGLAIVKGNIGTAIERVLTRSRLQSAVVMTQESQDVGYKPRVQELAKNSITAFLDE